MANTEKILRKLEMYRKDPDIVQPLSNAELADLVVVVLSQVRLIESAIDKKKLDLDKKIGSDATDLVVQTKREVEKLKADLTAQVRKEIVDGAKTLTESSTELEKRVNAALADIRNGDDGIITDEEIARAASLAANLVDLPDFDALITERTTANPESIRDALELLQDGDRYQVRITDVKDLEEKLNQLAQIRSANGGTIGKNQVYAFINQAIADGTISTGGATNIGDLEDVNNTAPNANQVLTWNDSSSEWEPADPPGASGGEANTASNLGTGEGVFGTKVGVDLRYKSLVGGTGVTLSADANEITIIRDALTLSDISDSGELAALDTVGTTEIDNDAVTFAKMQNIATNRILGRSTAGTGDIEALQGNDVRDIAGVDTTDSPQFAGVNIGHATDTTITRVSAGVIAVEGTTIARAGDNLSSFVNDAGYITAETDDQTAAEVPFTPAGNIAATDVQAALQELDTEKGTGDVNKVGTPVNNQVGVWTGDGTLEGSPGLTFDGTDLLLTDGEGLVVGHTNREQIGNQSAVQILGTSATDASMVIGRWTATAATPASLRFFKSINPAIGSNTIVPDNALIGSLDFYADDGVDNNTRIADIHVEVDDASPAAGDIGAAFVWRAMQGGGTGLTEQMRLAADGTLTVGGNEVYSATGTDVPVADGGTGASTAVGAFTNLKQDATTSATGVVELATTAEVNTGTDTGRTITPDALAGSNFGTRYIQATVFDYTTDLATGDGKLYVHIPPALGGMNLVYVHCGVITAGTTGTTDFQIHNVDQAADMLSTKATIDSGDTGTDAAATPYVIDTANDDVASGDALRLDIDAVSTTAPQGLVVTLGFQLP